MVISNRLFLSSKTKQMKKIYLLRKLVLKGASFTVHNVINVDEITSVIQTSGNGRIITIYYKVSIIC